MFLQYNCIIFNCNKYIKNKKINKWVWKQGRTQVLSLFLLVVWGGGAILTKDIWSQV